MKVIRLLLLFPLSILLLSGNSLAQNDQALRVLEASKYFEKYYLQVPQIIPIDIRPESDFKKAHIPGSVSDPGCKLKNWDPLLLLHPVLLMAGLQDWQQNSYCFKKYKNVFVLKNGFPSWIESGYPIESGNERAIILKKGCFTAFKKSSEDECK